jgi:peptide-methionine (S)-S-oxide reductase
MKKIVVAGGCFWGVEEYYRRLKGIENTRVGYAQGLIKNPSYQEVCTGKTNHAEVCELEYDETVISLEIVLEHLFRIVDPTSLNKQGHDVGTQYRVGVYFIDPKDKELIQAYYDKKASEYSKPLVMELEALREFYDAESYHQKYLVKNPGGYCHVNMKLIKDEEKK